MFVIYHSDSGRLVSDRRYVYKKVALRAVAKLDEYYKSVTVGSDYVSDLAVMAADEYYRTLGNQTRIVRNLMSGKEVEININTPLSCDPSSETYWSM